MANSQLQYLENLHTYLFKGIIKLKKKKTDHYKIVYHQKASRKMNRGKFTSLVIWLSKNPSA